MDPISFLLLFLIVVVGGVVAFLADRLGRKLGKKRLSLLGLRPRHTAEVLTVAAGMLIPLFTIIVLLAVSSGIREWALKGPKGVEELKNSIAGLKKEQAELKRSNNELVVNGEKTKKRYALEIAGLKKQTGDLKASVAQITQQRDEVKRQADRFKGQVARLNGTVSALNADLRTGRAQLQTVRATYKLLSGQFASLDEKYKGLRVNYKELDKQRMEAYTEVDRLRNDRDALQSQVGSLTQSKKDLDDQLVKAKEDLDRYQRDLASLKIDLEQSQQELDRLAAQKSALQAAFDTSLLNTRFGRVATPVGYELARVSLNPKESPIEARAALQSLLAQSSKAAEMLGAKPGKPGEGSAMLRDLPMANGKKITVDEQIAAIVKAVANLPEESVLVAYSYWNVYEGESVPLQIRPFRNPVVYRAGELIAESRIDGHLPDDQLIGQIKDGLLMSVRLRAKKDRMIPAGSDESFGAVTIEQLSALVRDLKAENRRVRLQAVAKNDTRAADQLQLLFKIKY